MKQKRNPDAGRAAALPAVMAAALLFLAVGLVLLNDLRKRLRGKHEHQEDSHGQHE